MRSVDGQASGSGGLQGEADGVDAVAGVLRGVALAVEAVPEVRGAAGAADLDPDHAVRAVLDVSDRARDGLVEARPAAVRVELGVAVEQGRPAGPAVVRAPGLGVHVLAGERGLGARLAQHPELGGGQAYA